MDGFGDGKGSGRALHELLIRLAYMCICTKGGNIDGMTISTKMQMLLELVDKAEGIPLPSPPERAGGLNDLT